MRVIRALMELEGPEIGAGGGLLRAGGQPASCREQPAGRRSSRRCAPFARTTGRSQRRRAGSIDAVYAMLDEFIARLSGKNSRVGVYLRVPRDGFNLGTAKRAPPLQY